MTTDNRTNEMKTYEMPEPLVAPFGYGVTRDMVRDVWEVFVKPGQSDDAPPQSVEMRVLMAILRAVYVALPETEREPGND